MRSLSLTERRRSWCMLLAIIVSIWSVTYTYNAQAQPAATNEATPVPATPADASDAGTNSDSLGGQIFKMPEQTSDWFAFCFYAVLGVFSIVAATVTLERLVNLRRDRILPAEFKTQLASILSQSTPTQTDLADLCDQWPSPVSRILASAITRAGRPLPEVEKAMEDAAVREISEMRSKQRPLNVIASTAPLVGLLGTVVGMIFAFQISSQVGLGKAEQLARGIYLALLTTAGGLTIAIPTLLVSAWFQGRVDGFFRQIDQVLMPVIPFFTRLEKKGAATEKPSSPSAISKKV